MIWFLVFLMFAEIYCDCNFGQRHSSYGLILQPITDDFVLSTDSSVLRVPDNGNISLFCETGFRGLDRVSDKLLLNLRCQNDRLFTKTKIRQRQQYSYGYEENGNEYEESDIGYDFQCIGFTVPYYTSKINNCAFSGLHYGLEVKGVPIVLAEFCYNFDKSDSVFVHYLASKRSHLLKQQIHYNPSKLSEHELSQHMKISLPQIDYPEIILENEWKTFSPYKRNVTKIIKFAYGELVPNSAYSSFLKDYVDGTIFNNAVPWWYPLKNGNWEIFQNILSRESTKTNFEIYAGKSHTALYPKEFMCDSDLEITFEFNGGERHIPLYIWNYIIPKASDENNEFVLIGVNSPFFENYKEIVFCQDICDTIEWLKPLQSTRKNPVFGYVFCCKPEEVFDKLYGFPHLNGSDIHKL